MYNPKNLINMEINEIKASWESARRDINTGSEIQPDNGRRTALQRLGDQYRRFSILSLIFMSCGAGSLWNAGVKSIWLIAIFFMLLGAASLTDYYLSRRIRAIDPMTMSVTEVLQRTLDCRKIHIRWVVFAVPVVIGWCAAMAWYLKADIYAICGICFGAIVGLTIGIRVLMNFMNDYRQALQD